MTTVQINDEFRVVIDSYNHTLEQQREVINPTTKEVRDKWCFVGYYPNMTQCLMRAAQETVLLVEHKDVSCTIQEYVAQLDRLHEKWSKQYNLRTQ